MNTRTARAIEEMKKQTIGVEIEMAEITRNQMTAVIGDQRLSQSTSERQAR